ncbi:MAG TPA: dihydrolipoyl dehydrogenase [Thermodesulfobacteriota bacterium]|nr:dihydrolipoyl dehydrogenase [Thermodesulfobacteriota bacterium]
MNSKECDLLVIGGGPGGYTAAIRAAQKGLKTILVERRALGGTCLNRGCVPSKCLIQDTLMISAVRNCHFMKGDMKINLKRIAERKDLVVEGSRTWVDKLLAGNGVFFLKGEASFTGPTAVEIKGVDGTTEQIFPKKTILATGAAAHHGEGLQIDGEIIWSTDDALALKTVPRSLAIVGAGNRGVEFASIYYNLGTKVAIIEKENNILPKLHRSLANRYKKILTERQIKVLTRTKVVATHAESGEDVTLILETEKGKQEIKVDKMLLTGSRQPDYSGLHLEAAGLTMNEGIVESGPGMQTQVEGIYVVGDAAGPPYFAHKAIVQAIVAVDHLLGLHPDGRHRFFPNCIWGDPEIGSIGLTEEEAEGLGHTVKVGDFYFIGNGRSGTLGNSQGLARIVSESKTGAVLGVHIIGPQATELISLASLAIQNGLDISGIKKTVFPHPTLSETFYEAALASDNEAIHMLLDSVQYGLED